MFAASKCIAAVVVLVPTLALASGPAPTLSLHVQPRELRLAEGGRVRVRVASQERPLVSVSTGRIEGLREVSSGIYEAEYAPPDSVDPQIAFVAAVTPSGGFGWTTISLAGIRTVTVRAPHRSLVSVDVDGSVYGPIPADGTGKAAVRVDVPPGVYEARTLGRRIALDVPRRAFSHVVLDRPSLQADASAEIAVRVLALSDRGAPLSKTPVKLEAAEGELTKPVEVARGVYQARWRVGAGPLRNTRITARVGGKLPSTAVAVLDRVAGEPVAVEVRPDRTIVVPGDGDELGVTAKVVDAAGNVTDTPAKLVVSVGTGETGRLLPDAVTEWQHTPDGYVGRVRVPRHRSGLQVLELKVIAPGSLIGTSTVELVPGEAASVRVEPEQDLLADGRSRKLRIVLLDSHGNRAESGGAAEVTAARGSLGEPTQVAPGLYVVDYRSPLTAADYDDVVRARVGPLEGQTEVRVRALGAMVVFGAKGGYARTFDGLGSASVGAELGLWRRSLASSFGVVLEGSWSSVSRSDTLSLAGSPLPVKMDATFVSIEPSVAWRRPLARGMLWLAVGPGYTQVNSTVSASGQPDAKTVSWVRSAHGSIGFGLPLGPGIPFAELKLGVQDEADDTPVLGAVQTYTVNVGYRFDVF